jgi:hypothetical protein
MLFRFITTGHGFTCMSRHGGTNKETTQMRRELQTLREEVNQLKNSRREADQFKSVSVRMPTR